MYKASSSSRTLTSSGHAGSELGRELCAVTSVEDMKKILECPVCFEITLPPIFQCKKGHIICQDCKNKVKKCGMCQEVFEDCRNRALENIMETSKFRCDYRESGCGVGVIGSEFEKHHQECKFRPIKCHYTSCDGGMIKFSDYLDHLKNVHKAKDYNVLDGNYSQKFSLTTSPGPKVRNWPFVLVKFDGQQFLTYTFRVDTYVYFCLLLLGDEIEARTYSVQISFGDERTPVGVKKLFTTTVPVLPIRRSAKELTALGITCMPAKRLKFFGTTTRVQGGETIKWCVNYKLKKSLQVTGYDRDPLPPEIVVLFQAMLENHFFG